MTIDPDVRRASTLPGSFYRDEPTYRRVLDAIASRYWHFVGDRSMTPSSGDVAPIRLLEEPLLLTREGEQLRAISNVCTHRGAILVEKPCASTGLRCRYHGRVFALDGRFVSMPEFKSALDFPRPEDNLAHASLASFGAMLFASLHPARPFDDLIAPLRTRLAALPIAEATIDPSMSRDYLVEAHWALYVDNYLEGFHVPFVHPALNTALDYRSYATELFDGGNVQIGIATDPRHALPGTDRIAALYFWLFPCTMLNVYPWGISLNAVQPLAIDRTRVAYRTFLFPGHASREGAGADLDRVELEDEAIVASVQQGVRSRLYPGGRFSPTREAGVHQFHRMLESLL